jgi:hypothetical protein
MSESESIGRSGFRLEPGSLPVVLTPLLTLPLLEITNQVIQPDYLFFAEQVPDFRPHTGMYLD